MADLGEERVRIIGRPWRAELVQPVPCRRVEVQLGSRERLAQLFGMPGADDRRGDARPVGDPGQRHLGGCRAVAVSDLAQSVHDGPDLIRVAAGPSLQRMIRALPGPGTCGRLAVTVVFAGEVALTEGPPAHGADAGIDGGGQDLPLDLAN